jgi:acyl-CoA synthetase (AMP-forming)/AMP-acid ligase II
MATLGEALTATAMQRGSAPALFYAEESFSYDDIAQRAAGIAGALEERGVHAGDRVAVGLANSPELVVTVLGVLRAGAVLVPLNPACTADEATYVVGDSGARVAIVEPQHAAALMQTALPDLSLIISAPHTLKGSPAHPASVDAEAPALIIYTSGTTGRPKGAVLSHRALLGNLTTVAQAWRWTADDRLLLTLPCFHLHGLGLGILTSFLIGSSVALRRRFVAEDTWADLERSQATMFFGVPTIYNRLVSLPATMHQTHDLRRVRLWVSGSAPLSSATFERFRERYGVDLMDRYGMTECGFVLSTPYEGPRRPGVVGRPLPGITVRLIDPEAADARRLSDVADGTPGEIAIRGPNLFSGYWNRPEETQRALIDGHLRSGDLAVREPDGMMRIVGRRSVDIIKTRGFKVGAVEIEDCLQRHPQVQEVAVVGIPDADQGERIVAVVTLLAGARAGVDDLRSHARQLLAPHKVPADIIFMDEIPRTGPGKFKKQELIQRLASQRGSVKA